MAGPWRFVQLGFGFGFGSEVCKLREYFVIFRRSLLQIRLAAAPRDAVPSDYFLPAARGPFNLSELYLILLAQTFILRALSLLPRKHRTEPAPGAGSATVSGFYPVLLPYCLLAPLGGGRSRFPYALGRADVPLDLVVLHLIHHHLVKLF